MAWAYAIFSRMAKVGLFREKERTRKPKKERRRRKEVSARSLT